MPNCGVWTEIALKKSCLWIQGCHRQTLACFLDVDVGNLTGRHSRRAITLWVWLAVRFTRVNHYVRKHVGTEKVSVLRSSGCPLFRGFQCIEVYGDTIRTVTSVRYIVGVRR